MFSAFDPELDRKVAIKLLQPGLAGSLTSDARARLLREAWAAASPRATPCITSSASRQPGRCWPSQARNVRPSTSSMAIHTCSSWVPTSKTPTTFGWLSFASACGGSR